MNPERKDRGPESGGIPGTPHFPFPSEILDTVPSSHEREPVYWKMEKAFMSSFPTMVTDRTAGYWNFVYPNPSFCRSALEL